MIQDDPKNSIKANNKADSTTTIQEKSQLNGELNVFKTGDGLYPYSIYDIGEA